MSQTTGMECASKVDGRLARGDAKRRAILDRAVDMASLGGLESLSIGKLATELGISKSGALLHFGSKEELQLAAIAHAAERFTRAVVVPALEHPAGLARLWHLTSGWLFHIEAQIFPGGCFFATVGAEFNARPGRVHDAIAAAHRHWSDLLEHQVEAARETGQLREEITPERLGFELDALLRQANMLRQLHGSSTVISHARQAVKDLIIRVATPEAARHLS
ncbi:MAG: TetR/AcrR family transcriptional regulator [Stackebrandtia sp.]